MKISGWGQYPTIEANILKPTSEQDVLQRLSKLEPTSLIPRGLGRSYGDSSLATTLLDTAALDYFISFDDEKGILRCAAGVSLDEILKVFVPKGWFLAVTPGTRYVTVGGAIASDVHGKNHHQDGCFSEFVTAMTIATVAQGLVECKRNLHADLFHASCGGMGLTGLIVEATIQLTRISSAFIDETIIKTRNLQETLTLFEQYHSTTYSVAWIDCLASGDSLGRSLIMLGEHAAQGGFVTSGSARLAVPVNMPGFMLNQFSIQLFNSLYYNRIRQQKLVKTSHYQSFFYPLDGIGNWNRMYGKNGFAQYQFVIPKQAGVQGLSEILKHIADSKRGSFLAVLKTFGKQNNNPLSFPLQGYTLALDFKMSDGLLEFFNELDSMVLNYGGRVYLSKDARLPEKVFKQMYPQWEAFNEVRASYQADKLFHSLQSKRLGL